MSDGSSTRVAVRAVGLRREYRKAGGPVVALDGVDLSVAEGEQVAVMGPSGSGKSTLLAVVGGLDRATAGTVTVLGTDLAGLDRRARTRFRRRRLGFIFQDHDLFDHLTAAENVSLGAAVASGDGDGDGDGEVDPGALLERLGLDEGDADKTPDQLSGGQKQRVGVARCLAARPRLILADEPTGSLDSVTSATVVGVLSKQARALGAAVIVVTHDPAVAARLDRTVWLRDGQVVEPLPQRRRG